MWLDPTMAERGYYERHSKYAMSAEGVVRTALAQIGLALRAIARKRLEMERE